MISMGTPQLYQGAPKVEEITRTNKIQGFPIYPPSLSLAVDTAYAYTYEKIKILFDGEHFRKCILCHKIYSYLLN